MSRSNVVGLMVARDEEVTVGMTIDTMAGLVDELVLINN